MAAESPIDVGPLMAGIDGEVGTADQDPASEWPEVDVVVVAHNGGDALRSAVQSILASRRVRAQVLVVDNASSDGSLDALDRLSGRLADGGSGRHGPAVSVLRLARNVGYGAGFNAGLARTTSPWVACANQDIVLHPDTLRFLVESATEGEAQLGASAIVGPRIVRPDGSTTETCHSIPSLGEECRRLLFSAKWRDAVTPEPAATARWVRCGWVSGVFLVGRRAVFEDLGGFDPDYFMYVEDLDLFRRLQDAGACCLWEPRVTVVHGGGVDPATRGAISGEMYALTLWNIGRYFEQHEPHASALKTTAVLGAGVIGASMRAALWSGRALRSRLRGTGGRQASDENAWGLARMFARAAYLSAGALVTGRMPKRVRRQIGRI